MLLSSYTYILYVTAFFQVGFYKEAFSLYSTIKTLYEFQKPGVAGENYYES